MKNTPPLGPAPTPAPVADPGPTLDAARRRVLRALTEATGGGTVADVAAAVGGHPNTARHHLRQLMASGLVDARPDRRRDPGRPATRFTVTVAGRRALGGGPGDPSVQEYLQLVGAFADRLAALGVDASAESRSVGRAWGAALARHDDPGSAAPPTGPSGRVVALLDRLGFSPRGRDDEPREVELRTCPLLDAARRHPEVVCEVHAGLVDGADKAYGGTGRGVVLRPFAAPGACLLRLPRGR